MIFYWKRKIFVIVSDTLSPQFCTEHSSKTIFIMKKNCLTTTLLAISFSLLFALKAISQTHPYPSRLQQNGLDVAMGVGVLGTFHLDQGKVITPPVSLKFGYQTKRNFMLSTIIGYSANSGVASRSRFTSIVQVRSHFFIGWFARWVFQGYRKILENIWRDTNWQRFYPDLCNGWRDH